MSTISQDPYSMVYSMPEQAMHAVITPTSYLISAIFYRNQIIIIIIITLFSVGLKNSVVYKAKEKLKIK